MSETPPTDSKPKRRSAPRKRSATKRAVKKPPDAPVASSAAVERVLDPSPVGDIDVTPSASATTAADCPRSTDAPVVQVASTSEAPTAALPAAAPPGPTQPLRQAQLRPGELIRVPLSVRWRDLDAFNHVNNSKYLSYLEEARLRWMLTMPGMGLEDDVAPVVAASNLNYRRPIGWPGEVVIELFVERLGTSSVTIGHRIVDVSEGGVTYCDGNVVMVWIDRSSGRAAPLPAAVRAACSAR